MIFRGARLPAFGAPPAGGCPLRMAGRGTGFIAGPGPRLRRGPGRIDFQSDTSGHPPGALVRAAAAPRLALRPTERPRASRSSRCARRAVRSNAQAARSCPANAAYVAPHWSPRRHGRPTARRLRITAPIPGAFGAR